MCKPIHCAVLWEQSNNVWKLLKLATFRKNLQLPSPESTLGLSSTSNVAVQRLTLLIRKVCGSIFSTRARYHDQLSVIFLTPYRQMLGKCLKYTTTDPNSSLSGTHRLLVGFEFLRNVGMFTIPTVLQATQKSVYIPLQSTCAERCQQVFQ